MDVVIRSSDYLISKTDTITSDNKIIEDTIKQGKKIESLNREQDDFLNNSLKNKKASSLSEVNFVSPPNSNESIYGDYLSNNKVPVNLQKSKAFAVIKEYDSDKYVSSKNADFYYMNGIQTTPDEGKKTTDMLSSIIGKKIEFFWSEKEGLVGDLIKAVKIDQKNNERTFSNNANKHMSSAIINSLEKNNNVKIISHSRGASEVANILWNVRSELALSHKETDINKLMSRIQVVTIGGLSSPSDFPSDIKLSQITNPKDPVPKLSSTKNNQERDRYSKIENYMKKNIPYLYENGSISEHDRMLLINHLNTLNRDDSGWINNAKNKLNKGSDVLVSTIGGINPSNTSNKEMLNTTTLFNSFNKPTMDNLSKPVLGFVSLGITPYKNTINFAILVNNVKLLKETTSEHLINTGTSNYLGEKIVQDYLKNFAND